MQQNLRPYRWLLAIQIICSEQRGNTAIEFALIACGLLTFCIGIIQFGYALWLQNALNYSVAAAARCASLSCSTNIVSYAAGASGAPFDSSVFTLSTPSCGNQVSASYPMTITVPFVNSFSVTLTAQACYPS